MNISKIPHYNSLYGIIKWDNIFNLYDYVYWLRLYVKYNFLMIFHTIKVSPHLLPFREESNMFNPYKNLNKYESTYYRNL